MPDFDPARLKRVDEHLARYVDDGRLAGWQLAVTRGDRVAHESLYGWRDRGSGLPLEADALWRIASMTKPVISVAAMTLWEQGAFELTDPITRWLPAFADARVYVSGAGDAVVTRPATEPIRVWHLLTHTSGLTAGFMRTTAVDALYREAGYDLGAPPHPSIAECVEDWARLPLLFEPGTGWGYGVSHDVLGRLVEIWAGQPLDLAVAHHVLDPIGMPDTVWHCDGSRRDRLTTVHVPDAIPGGPVVGDEATSRPAIFSGGGGLLSTMADFARFALMLAGEGAVGGRRVLAPQTVRLLRSNHLPPELTSRSAGASGQHVVDGIGFGFGVAITVDPLRLHSVASPGEYSWGGIFGTTFWVDPVEELTCTFMTQLAPPQASTLAVGSELRQLVYSALV